MPRARAKFRVTGDGRIITIGGDEVKTKRQFIIEILRHSGEEGSYPAQMFRGWKRLCGEVGKSPGTYETFRQAVFFAKQDGLIEPFREEKGNHYYPRVYYRIKRY